MTAPKDPLYREIKKRLSERLDPALFERCALELLRPVYPGLVPVSGGNDAGMDGAISMPTGGPAVPLVCTTSEDVIGNLTKNLESYKRSDQKGREAVLATSQALTVRRRRNLEKRAREMGFELLNVHDGHDVTGRLYREPTWRRELLGLAGDLPALSVYPRLHQPRVRYGADQTLVGRDEAASWVLSQRDDFVLVGQPGVGKRSLLRLLAEKGRGRFVVTNNLAQIADDYRAAQPQPEFLLLEDAHLLGEDSHLRSDLLSAICRMRQEIRASFKIAATTWPGQQVALAINPAEDVASKEIVPLSRTDTHKIVRSIFPKLHKKIIAEIVNQSECRPGLAVTLAEYAEVHGEFGQLIDGRLLLSHLMQSLASRGLTSRDLDVLAAFALAGSAGAALDKVADVLGEREVDVCTTLSKVAHIGIIKDCGVMDRRLMAVANPALRTAMVARTFFRGSSSLSASKHLAAIPDRRSGTKVLIDALARRALVGHELIQSLLLDDATDETDQELWQRYAQTGKRAVKWIVHNHPRRIPTIAYWALRKLPAKTLPTLLSAISTQQEDTRSPADGVDSLVTWYTQPELSAIAEWIREPARDTMQRRRQLLDALRVSLEGPCRLSRGLHLATRLLVRLVFSVRLRKLDPDPIELGSQWIVIGALRARHVKQLHELWKQSGDLLRKTVVVDTAREIAAKWAADSWHYGDDLPCETAGELENLAVGMIADVVQWSNRRAGVLLWAHQVAHEFNVPIPDLSPAPSDLEDLFGIRPEEAERDRQDNATRLATKLASQDTTAAVDRLLYYQEEACLTLHSASALRTVENVIHHIAEHTQEPAAWVTALASRQADVRWATPFADAMLAKGHVCEKGWRALLDCNEYCDVIVPLATRRSEVPEDVIEYILRWLVARKVMLIGHWKDVSNTWKERLLTHDQGHVAVAAACEMYREYQDHDPELATLSRTVRTTWYRAIVKCDDEALLASVFERHPNVAKAWLLSPDRRLPTGPSEVSKDDIVDELIEALGRLHTLASPTLYGTAASVLDSDTKLQLVREMSAETDPTAFIELVGNDATPYEALLSRRDLKPLHLGPLVSGVLSPDFAKLAVNHGYSPEDIAGQIAGWTTDIRHEAMGHWERHPDPAVREIYCRVKEMET